MLPFLPLRYRTSGNVFETFKKGVTVYDITPDFLRKFEKSKLEDELSPVSISSYIIDLRRIINYYTKVIPLIPQSYEYPFGEGKYQIKKQNYLNVSCQTRKSRRSLI